MSILRYIVNKTTAFLALNEYAQETPYWNIFGDTIRVIVEFCKTSQLIYTREYSEIMVHLV